MMTLKSLKPNAYLLLTVLGFIWGSSFILMKFGLRDYHHSQVAALRIFVSFLCFLPYIYTRRAEIPWKDLRWLTLAGLLGSGMPAFLFTLAQTRVDSSTAGVLNSLVPIFALLSGAVLFGVRIVPASALGVVIGFCGAITLILFRNQGGFHPDWYGLFIVLATLMYGVNINLIKARFTHLRPITLAAATFAVMGPLAGAYLFGVTGFGQMEFYEGRALWSLLAVVLLAVMGTVVALILFNRLIQMTSAVFASTVTYLIPIAALFWGILDGEAFGWVQIMGMTGILIGVYLSRLKAPKPPKAGAPV